MPRTTRVPFASLIIIIFLGILGRPTLVDAAVLRGVVTDPDGRPARGAQVVLVGSTTLPAVVTDERGRYQFPDLGAGTYTVHAILKGFGVHPVRLTVPADGSLEVDLRLYVSAITESIVVSAAMGEYSRSRTPASVTVMTREDLQARQIESVADALRLVPGMTVVASGGRGSITSLFPRGGESDSTLVLIDGMQVNTFGGSFDFAQLLVGGIERIEIIRGPQSALYGSNAIGAVVQVFTRHGGETGIDGAIEGGSFGTARATLSASGSSGAFSWGASAERLSTDGFTGEAPATGELVSNDDYDLTNAAFSGAWRHGSRTSIRGDLRLNSTERGFPGPFGSDPLGNVSTIDRISRGTSDSVLASAKLTHAWSDRLVQHVSLDTSDLDGAFVSPFGVSDSKTRRSSIRFQNDFTVNDGLSVAGGFEYLGERAHSSFITGGSAQPIPVRRHVAGLFGEGRYDSSDRVVMTAGVRLEHIKRSGLEADPNAFQPRPAFDAESVVSLNPKLSVSYFLQPVDRRVSSWTRLRANAGTGIRPPSAFEIAFTDNPSLQPERSRSLDVGIEQTLASGKLVIGATGFYNSYDDLIVSVGRSFADASQFRTDNIANARSRGLELLGSFRSAWGLEARVGYTWLDTDVLAVDGQSGEAPPPFTVGQPLIRRPRHQGSLDLVFSRDWLTLYSTLGARGDVLDIEPSYGAFGGLFEASGYATLDFGGQVRLQRNLQVYARMTNALDNDYEEAFGFLALGRAFTVGLRVATSR